MPLKRKCKGCNKYTIERGADRRIKVCSDPCRDKVIAEAIAKCRADRERQQRKAAKVEKQERARRKKEFYERDVPHLLKATQTVVNRLVKLLDQGKPCISCGRPDEGGRKRHASHYKSIGANSGLRFDLRNINDSCVVCNQHLSGNIAGYTNGLRERYGQEWVDYLDQAPRLKKWTPEELKEIRTEAQAEIKRLEKGLPPSRDWRALPKQINELEREKAA